MCKCAVRNEFTVWQVCFEGCTLSICGLCNRISPVRLQYSNFREIRLRFGSLSDERLLLLKYRHFSVAAKNVFP